MRSSLILLFVCLLSRPAAAELLLGIDSQWTGTIVEVEFPPRYEAGVEIGAQTFYRFSTLWAVGVRYGYQWGFESGVESGDQTGDMGLTSLSAVVRCHARHLIGGEVRVGYLGIRDRDGRLEVPKLAGGAALLLEARVLLARIELGSNAGLTVGGGYRLIAGGAPEIEGTLRRHEVRWHAVGIGLGLEYGLSKDR